MPIAEYAAALLEYLADPQEAGLMRAYDLGRRTLNLEVDVAELGIAQGLDPLTPAVAVANATRPDETIVAGTIADIADKVEADAPDGPVLVMIGKVLAEVAAGRNGHAYRRQAEAREASRARLSESTRRDEASCVQWRSVGPYR